MGLFGKKSTVVDEAPVAFDRERALSITNVQNLQADVVAVASRIGWDDRTAPSPVVQATLRPGVDTYGKERVGIYVGKTCVGYFGGPNSRGMTATRAAVVFELHGALVTGWACPDV